MLGIDLETEVQGKMTLRKISETLSEIPIEEKTKDLWKEKEIKINNVGATIKISGEMKGASKAGRD